MAMPAFLEKPSVNPHWYQTESYSSGGQLSKGESVENTSPHDLPQSMASFVIEPLVNGADPSILGEALTIPANMEFILNNHSILNTSLVKQIVSVFVKEGIGEDLCFRLHLGLEETLSNAVIHGNLEIHSEAYQSHENFANWQREIQRRLLLKPYCDRQVDLNLSIQSEQIVIRVTDQGEGFDYRSVLASTPEDLFQPHGRGLSMLGNFAEIHFNETGNQITLIFQRNQGIG